MSSGMSNAASSVSQSFTSAMQSSTSSAASAMSSARDAVAAQEHSGWLGAFGRLILFLLNIISVVLYWVLRITTFNIPSILFALFSTSWTVTMNATTLYVPSIL
jgi:lysophospholipid hydrolase